MPLKTKYFYEFGPYRLDPVQHLLTYGEEAVPLTPKIYETLLVLVESGGQIVTKGELMNRICPDSFVEEGNLTLNISLLRKALAKFPDCGPFIETVRKRGHRFLAGVKLLHDHTPDLMAEEHSRSRVVVQREYGDDSGQAEHHQEHRGTRNHCLGHGFVIHYGRPRVQVSSSNSRPIS
jgi:DNA-binding winged helix-turn-helix (wHTH) protein